MKKLYNGLMLVGTTLLLIGNTLFINQVKELEGTQQELQNIIINQDRTIEKINSNLDDIKSDITELGKKDKTVDEEIIKIQKDIKNIK